MVRPYSFLIVLLAACDGGEQDDLLSSATDPTTEFDILAPVVDTSWPVDDSAVVETDDTEVVVDTDVVDTDDTDVVIDTDDTDVVVDTDDTDVVDTDIIDTDIIDTDVLDTDIVDTDLLDTDVACVLTTWAEVEDASDVDCTVSNPCSVGVDLELIAHIQNDCSTPVVFVTPTTCAVAVYDLSDSGAGGSSVTPTCTSTPTTWTLNPTDTHQESVVVTGGLAAETWALEITFDEITVPSATTSFVIQ